MSSKWTDISTCNDQNAQSFVDISMVLHKFVLSEFNYHWSVAVNNCVHWVIKILARSSTNVDWRKIGCTGCPGHPSGWPGWPQHGWDEDIWSLQSSFRKSRLHGAYFMHNSIVMPVVSCKLSLLFQLKDNCNVIAYKVSYVFMCFQLELRWNPKN